MTAPIRWTLPPTGSRIVAALRYLSATFFGESLLPSVAPALLVFGASALLVLVPGRLFVPVSSLPSLGIELLLVLSVRCIA